MSVFGVDSYTYRSSRRRCCCSAIRLPFSPAGEKSPSRFCAAALPGASVLLPTALSPAGDGAVSGRDGGAVAALCCCCVALAVEAPSTLPRPRPPPAAPSLLWLSLNPMCAVLLHSTNAASAANSSSLRAPTYTMAIRVHGRACVNVNRAGGNPVRKHECTDGVCNMIDSPSSLPKTFPSRLNDFKSGTSKALGIQ